MSVLFDFFRPTREKAKNTVKLIFTHLWVMAMAGLLSIIYLQLPRFIGKWENTINIVLLTILSMINSTIIATVILNIIHPNYF